MMVFQEAGLAGQWSEMLGLGGRVVGSDGLSCAVSKSSPKSASEACLAILWPHEGGPFRHVPMIREREKE